MHIFIQLPSVDLNTGVKSEIASLPELEHNSVHVKNMRQYVVNYRVKNYSFESKWQNFQCYGCMTSKYVNTPQNCHLLSWFSSQNESDWCFLFGWISYLGKRDLCNEVATSSTPQLLQLIGDSDWQVGRSHCLPFQQGKESSAAFCCLYRHWYCIPAKSRGAAVSHPPTLHSSKALWAAPEDRLCLSTSALLCSASTSSGERARLTLYLSRLNHLKPFVPNQPKIALYWPHRVIC